MSSNGRLGPVKHLSRDGWSILALFMDFVKAFWIWTVWRRRQEFGGDAPHPDVQLLQLGHMDPRQGCSPMVTVTS